MLAAVQAQQLPKAGEGQHGYQPALVSVKLFKERQSVATAQNQSHSLLDEPEGLESAPSTMC